jgi:D-alanyl-D-alanine carboxypeptidase/D-alanyl-D-alanine-endopeptidase (penicillin-binding protein 4)
MRYTTIFFALLLCISCKTQQIKTSLRNSEVFGEGLAGIIIYDPAKKKTLYAQNETLYFIPASNTKLFTFYVSRKILEEHVNGLNYVFKGDSLIFWGSGDPSFLHPDFHSNTAYDLLKSHKGDLFFANNFDQVDAYGPGWSWDWYNYYFATERSAFPVYGNVVRFKKDISSPFLTFSPSFFEESISISPKLFSDKYLIRRDEDFNRYHYSLGREDSLSFVSDKPFITSDTLMIEMLKDTLGREIKIINYGKVKGLPHKELPTVATDSLQKQMMLISDNFLAEQLLLMASDKLFDSLNIDAVINYSLDNFLSDLPDRPRWVDGSGLSSMNLFTPRSIIKLLGKIREEVPEETIYSIFLAGGKAGTIKDWYHSDDGSPYIYAKTGTLSNSICLSGFLFTKSNKVLLFSFMLNNFMLGSNVLKQEMERILYQIHIDY